jgi:hypothetical protein
MNFEAIQEYLENAGYNIAGMSADEVDALAEAESFSYNESRNRYEYQG